MSNYQTPNPQDDILYKRIKEIIYPGKTFKSGWNELYREIGLETLGVKSLDGGKQKKKAKDLVQQYCSFCSLENHTREIQCICVYDEPHYLESKDGRGENGVYLDRLYPLALYSLSHQQDQEMTITIKELSRMLGIVNQDYGKVKCQDLKGTELETNKKYFNDFCIRTDDQLKRIIFPLFRKLKSEHCISNFEISYRIKTEKGSKVIRKTSQNLIEEAEQEVLEELNLPNIRMVFLKNMSEEFYKKVCVKLSTKLKITCLSYYQVIRLEIDKVETFEIADKMDLNFNKIAKYQTEIRNRIAEAIWYKTMTDYMRNQCKADRITNKEIKKFLNLEQIQEYKKYGWDYSDEAYRFINRPYRLTEKYIEVQEKLIKHFITNKVLS